MRDIKYMKINILLILISFSVFISGQRFSDSTCTIEHAQSPGICKAISDCPSVIKDIKNRRNHTRCRFEGRKEIVCCPIESHATTIPRPTLNSNSRISEKKCDQYTSAVYEYHTSLALTVESEIHKIPVDKCGHKSTALIVGGEFSKPREFPHMALIGFMQGNEDPKWVCGGTLISDEYVLTAGHCLNKGLCGKPAVVRLGELNISTETDDAFPEDYVVSNIILHPEYTNKLKYNDIALIKLNRKVKLNPYKRPACLPTTFDNTERNVIATGWGHTAWSGNTSNHLQKVTLEKFNHRDCNASYISEISRQLRYGIVPNTQICAGSKNEQKDTCQGDSGGPLQIYHPYQYCMYTIIGVTSFGITCGKIGVPGVYTRVFPYLDWIESVVWGNVN